MLQAAFTGCLRDLRFNELQVPFRGVEGVVEVVQSDVGSMTDGCTSDDVCAAGANPCADNTATCADAWNLAVCTCVKGWGPPGVCTENLQDCTADSCQNGGRCIDEVATFSCDCNSTGFEGPRLTFACSIPPKWGVNPISSGSPHVRCTPMWVHRTCGA